MTDSTFARLALFRGSRVASLVLCGVLLSACAVGPDYKRPDVVEPAQFKEAKGGARPPPVIPWPVVPGGSCTATASSMTWCCV